MPLPGRVSATPENFARPAWRLALAQAVAVAAFGADGERCDQNHSWIENFRVLALFGLLRLARDPLERGILSSLAACEAEEM